MGIFGGKSGEKAAPLQRIAYLLSMTVGVAASFVFTPRIYSLSVDWAVTSAELGPFLTWVGSVVWFCIVALLAVFATGFALLSIILLATFGSGLLMARLRQ